MLLLVMPRGYTSVCPCPYSGSPFPRGTQIFRAHDDDEREADQPTTAHRMNKMKMGNNDGENK